jgi:hypothetical protein
LKTQQHVHLGLPMAECVSRFDTVVDRPQGFSSGGAKIDPSRLPESLSCTWDSQRSFIRIRSGVEARASSTSEEAQVPLVWLCGNVRSATKGEGNS